MRGPPVGAQGETLAPGDGRTDFARDLSLLPAQHPRRIGLFLMQIGMSCALASLCLGLALMHICCGIAALGALLARPPIHRLPGFWIAVAFTAWQILSFATVVLSHRHAHPLGSIGMMYTWVSLYLAQFAFIDARVRRWALRPLLATLAVSCLVSALQFFIGLGGAPPLHIAAPPLGIRLHHSTGFAPVHLTQAFLMTLIGLIFLQLPALDAGAGPAPAWSGRALAFTGLVLANARGAFVAAAVAIAVALSGKMRLVTVFATALGLLIFFAVGVYVIDRRDFYEIPYGKNSRFAIWEVSADLVGAAPLVGSGGADGFKVDYHAAFERIAPPDPDGLARVAPHAHSSYLAIAAQHGVPAALLHLAWMAAVLLAAYRDRGTDARSRCWTLALAATTAFLVDGLFENLAGHTATAYTYYLTLGLAIAAGVRPQGQSARQPAEKRTEAPLTAPQTRGKALHTPPPLGRDPSPQSSGSPS